ncbi:MAG: AbrB/MazE/SpoVT family DNA-binding domain-containing protein, partial [Candidatus Ranarchaeia archaeon]
MSNNVHRESRKLVKWGSSNTLIVSLPRRWIKKNNLTEKDEIEIRETSDGALMVTALFEEDADAPPAIVDANSLKSLEAISQAMLVKYLDG